MGLFKKETFFFSSIAAGTFIVVAVSWFLTPLPTMGARYVWNEWHAGTLALALDRSDADLAFAIGNYYFGNQTALGTTEERPYNLALAKKAFSRAVALNPSLPLTHYMRARIEFIQSDFTAALADLSRERSLFPENERALYMRGLTYAYRGFPGDLIRAEQDFKEFIIWAPREWAGYNDLAFVLAKSIRYTHAAAVLKEGIERADGGDRNPWLWNALGVMELNSGNFKDAVSVLTKAQTFAASLTDVEWQKAYPGNDPSNTSTGIEAMQMSIAQNLVTARTKSGK